MRCTTLIWRLTIKGVFPITSVDRELINGNLDQHQYLYHVSRLLFASTHCVTYPTDAQCAIIKPQLPLVLANPEPHGQESTRNRDQTPGHNGHQRSVVLRRVADPGIYGRHLGWIRRLTWDKVQVLCPARLLMYMHISADFCPFQTLPGGDAAQELTPRTQAKAIRSRQFCGMVLDRLLRRRLR